MFCPVSLRAQKQRDSIPQSSELTGNAKATFESIAKKIDEQGEIKYVMTSRSINGGEPVTDSYEVQTWNSTFDLTNCELRVDSRMKLNGAIQSTVREVINLRRISRLLVVTQSQAIQERTAKAGVTDWKGSVSPESYVFEVFQSNGLYGILFFRTLDAANQVRKNMKLAMSLCGGNRFLK